jgi:hypothetical protein
MPDFDIQSESGEQFSIGGQITKPVTVGQPPPWPNYPTSATGFKLTFTAKRRKTDPTPLVKRDSVADPTNVSLANGGAWTVKLLAADTSLFTKTEELLYDVVLTEPGGGADITVVSEGTWTVEKSVGL